MGPLPSSSVPDGNPISQLASASSAPVIAVDLDDVLSQTNLVVAQCTHDSPADVAFAAQLTTPFAGHNETYGTDMDLSSFYCSPFFSHTLNRACPDAHRQTITGGRSCPSR